MSLSVAILVGLLMGIVFGFALEKSRVFEPGMIVGQMQLRNFIMLKVFLTAVATGAVALYAADIVGGLILGVGIVLAGACPGTTLAQIGVGYRDAVFTLLGGLAGAIAFTYAQPSLAGFLAAGDGKIIFTGLLGIPYWIGALGFAAILVAVLVLLERWRPWREEMGRDVDGDFGAPATPPSPSRVRIAPAE
jgi:uncharacterized membrane protein YedE/YeeE